MVLTKGETSRCAWIPIPWQLAPLRPSHKIQKFHQAPYDHSPRADHHAGSPNVAADAVQSCPLFICKPTPHYASLLGRKCKVARFQNQNQVMKWLLGSAGRNI